MIIVNQDRCFISLTANDTQIWSDATDKPYQHSWPGYRLNSKSVSFEAWADDNGKYTINVNGKEPKEINMNELRDLLLFWAPECQPFLEKLKET